MIGRVDADPVTIDEEIAELRRRKRVALREYDRAEDDLRRLLAVRKAEQLSPDTRRRAFRVLVGGAS